MPSCAIIVGAKVPRGEREPAGRPGSAGGVLPLEGGSMFRKSLGIALLLLVIAPVLAQAGVPRVVMIEDFGATW